MILTQETLKQFISYDQHAGTFTRLVCKGNPSRIGPVKGSLDADGYASLSVCRKKYQAHRLAWLYVYGEWPTGQVDHINGHRSDNRILNLRDVNNQQNSQNQKFARSNSKTGLLGARWHAPSRTFVAQIGVLGKKRHLGCFKTAEDAYAAYLLAKRELHPLWVPPQSETIRALKGTTP